MTVVIRWSTRSRRRRSRYAAATQFGPQYRRRGDASFGSRRRQRRYSQRRRFAVTPVLAPIIVTSSSVTPGRRTGKATAGTQTGRNDAVSGTLTQGTDS
ncbi:hypothetical protein [Streptomyces microflavus]|uniref:hypothetical protein n=1 Tax=Streptomyces microflavus TaxID=1919 RepID=UPI0036E3F2AB